MVAQSASGQFRSSDTVSLADGVSATNPFAGFSASAQAITIAGQNALLQSAVKISVVVHRRNYVRRPRLKKKVKKNGIKAL